MKTSGTCSRGCRQKCGKRRSSVAGATCSQPMGNPRLRCSKYRTVYLSAMSGYVEARWMGHDPDGLIADCVRHVVPGETFLGLSYEKLREFAQHRGKTRTLLPI